jgi:hypothetical protein
MNRLRRSGLRGHPRAPAKSKIVLFVRLALGCLVHCSPAVLAVQGGSSNRTAGQESRLCRDPRGHPGQTCFSSRRQRDPGLAERSVHRTITTNVFSIRDVLTAAEEYEVRRVVMASAGRALRPFALGVYCAPECAAGWLAALAAVRSGALCTAPSDSPREVDNSIIHARCSLSAAAPSCAFTAQALCCGQQDEWRMLQTG